MGTLPDVEEDSPGSFDEGAEPTEIHSSLGIAPALADSGILLEEGSNARTWALEIDLLPKIHLFFKGSEGEVMLSCELLFELTL